MSPALSLYVKYLEEYKASIKHHIKHLKEIVKIEWEIKMSPALCLYLNQVFLDLFKSSIHRNWGGLHRNLQIYKFDNLI